MYPLKIQVQNVHMTICNPTGDMAQGEMDLLKMYLILSGFIVLKVIAKINQSQIATIKRFTSYLGFGEIQFMRKEVLVTPNSYKAEIVVERFNIVKDNVEVKWKLANHDGQNGTIVFNNTIDQKVIKLDLQNVTRNLLVQIELYDPTNGYQLGENKVANISFVSKFLLILKQIKKEVS